MKYQIRWTEKSAETFEEIIIFIRENWGEKVVAQFVKDSFNTFQLIARFPLMFKSIQNKKIRKGFINKHISLYYRINQECIELLYFWDNRRNPQNNEYKK